MMGYLIDERAADDAAAVSRGLMLLRVRSHADERLAHLFRVLDRDRNGYVSPKVMHRFLLIVCASTRPQRASMVPYATQARLVLSLRWLKRELSL